jgi:hypothetical protein
MILIIFFLVLHQIVKVQLRNLTLLSVPTKLNDNGSRLGEVGDFENETLKLLLNLN